MNKTFFELINKKDISIKQKLLELSFYLKDFGFEVENEKSNFISYELKHKIGVKSWLTIFPKEQEIRLWVGWSDDVDYTDDLWVFYFYHLNSEAIFFRVASEILREIKNYIRVKKQSEIEIEDKIKEIEPLILNFGFKKVKDTKKTVIYELPLNDFGVEAEVEINKEYGEISYTGEEGEYITVTIPLYIFNTDDIFSAIVSEIKNIIRRY